VRCIVTCGKLLRQQLYVNGQALSKTNTFFLEPQKNIVNDESSPQDEVLDARQELAERDSIFSSNAINTLNLFQANVNCSFGANNSST